MWTLECYCCQVGIFASLYAFLLGLDLMGVAFKALGGKGLGLRNDHAGVSTQGLPNSRWCPTKMTHLVKGTFGVPTF